MKGKRVIPSKKSESANNPPSTSSQTMEAEAKEEDQGKVLPVKLEDDVEAIKVIDRMEKFRNLKESVSKHSIPRIVPPITPSPSSLSLPEQGSKLDEKPIRKTLSAPNSRRHSPPIPPPTKSKASRGWAFLREKLRFKKGAKKALKPSQTQSSSLQCVKQSTDLSSGPEETDNNEKGVWALFKNATTIGFAVAGIKEDCEATLESVTPNSASKLSFPTTADHTVINIEDENKERKDVSCLTKSVYKIMMAPISFGQNKNEIIDLDVLDPQPQCSSASMKKELKEKESVIDSSADMDSLQSFIINEDSESSKAFGQKKRKHEVKAEERDSEEDRNSRVPPTSAMSRLSHSQRIGSADSAKTAKIPEKAEFLEELEWFRAAIWVLYYLMIIPFKVDIKEGHYMLCTNLIQQAFSYTMLFSLAVYQCFRAHWLVGTSELLLDPSSVFYAYEKLFSAFQVIVMIFMMLAARYRFVHVFEVSETENTLRIETLKKTFCKKAMIMAIAAIFLIILANWNAWIESATKIGFENLIDDLKINGDNALLSTDSSYRGSQFMGWFVIIMESLSAVVSSQKDLTIFSASLSLYFVIHKATNLNSERQFDLEQGCQMFVTIQNISKTISLAIGPMTLMFFVELIPFAVFMEHTIVDETFTWGVILVCALKLALILLSAEANGNAQNLVNEIKINRIKEISMELVKSSNTLEQNLCISISHYFVDCFNNVTQRAIAIQAMDFFDITHAVFIGTIGTILGLITFLHELDVALRMNVKSGD